MQPAPPFALLPRTQDGANIEIAEEIGQDNMFIFGARAERVPQASAGRAALQLHGPCCTPSGQQMHRAPACLHTHCC